MYTVLNMLVVNDMFHTETGITWIIQRKAVPALLHQTVVPTEKTTAQPRVTGMLLTDHPAEIKMQESTNRKEQPPTAGIRVLTAHLKVLPVPEVHLDVLTKHRQIREAPAR